MNDKKLKKILKKHRKWLHCEKGGKKAKLRGADLRGTNLSGADFMKADLREVNLSKATLRKVDFIGAKLSNADLSGCDLTNAELMKSDFYEANLFKTNLQGADLKLADLDHSCYFFSCGFLNVHIDDRIAIQILYHLLSNVSFSKHISSSIKNALITNELIALANKFHRVEECGELSTRSKSNA